MADEKYVDAMELFKGEDKLWYYRAKSNNGEILFTSEGYKNKGDAKEFAERVAENHDVTVRDVKEEEGESGDSAGIV